MATGTEALGAELLGQGTRVEKGGDLDHNTHRSMSCRGDQLKVSVLSLLVHCEVDQWRALGRCSGRSADLVVIIGS